MSFDIHLDLSEHSEDPAGEEAVRKYVKTLLGQFATSPEAQALPGAPEGLGWAGTQVQLGLDYLGITPPETVFDALEEIVFELFPRKVTVQPSAAGEIVAELAAFWRFLQRKFELDNAADCLVLFGDGAVDLLEEALADTRLFGPAKKFGMFCIERGYQLESQEDMNEAMEAYNLELAEVRQRQQELHRRETAPNVKRRQAVKKNRRKAAKASRRKNRKRK